MRYFKIDFYIWMINKKRERVLKFLGTQTVSDFITPGNKCNIVGKAFRVATPEQQTATRVVINYA